MRAAEPQHQRLVPLFDLLSLLNFQEYRSIFAQDLGLGGFTDGEFQDGRNIPLDINDPRPIRTKDNLIGIPLQIREVLEEVLGGRPVISIYTFSCKPARKKALSYQKPLPAWDWMIFNLGKKTAISSRKRGSPYFMREPGNTDDPVWSITGMPSSWALS